MVATKLALLAIAASSLVLAQPHGHRGHHHGQHEKRDENVVIVYETAPIVYVDQNGNVIDGYVPTASTSAPVAPPVYVQPTTTSEPAPYVPPTTTAAAPSKTQSTAPAESSSSSSSDAIFGKAIVYSPYHNNGDCKDASDVSTDLNHIIGSNNYAGVRLYGVDCSQVENVLPVARSLGIKVMLGIYDVSQAQSEAETIINAVGGDWDVVHSIGVGNEEVNNAVNEGLDGKTAAAGSLAAAALVKGVVSAAGFTGQVVTPEVFWRITEFPELCGSSSFVAANAHPFFDGGVLADGAGNWLSEQTASIEKACGKPVLITETGWPTAGSPNGVAVPSTPNQDTVLSQACSSLNDDLVILGAYNDKWKNNNSGTFGAENFWGVLGDSITN